MTSKKIDFQTAARRVYAELVGTPDINWNEIVPVDRQRMEEAYKAIIEALKNGELTLWAVSSLLPKDGGATAWAVPKLTSAQYRQGLRMTRLSPLADQTASLTGKPHVVTDLNAAGEKYFIADAFDKWMHETFGPERARMQALDNMHRGDLKKLKYNMGTAISDAVKACFPDGKMPARAKDRDRLISEHFKRRGECPPDTRTIQRHLKKLRDQ